MPTWSEAPDRLAQPSRSRDTLFATSRAKLCDFEIGYETFDRGARGGSIDATFILRVLLRKLAVHLASRRVECVCLAIMRRD